MRHHVGNVLRLAVIAATLLGSTTALAGPGRPRDNDRHHQHWRHKPSKPPKSVPEFDPAAAGGIGAILAGGGVLLARWRKRSS